MTPARENRIREAIRNGLMAHPSLYSENLMVALSVVEEAAHCTTTEARAVWDRHFAITDAN